MTKIILFVIALQVVLGILAKRKARKRAQEAAQDPTGAMGEDAPGASRIPLPSATRTPSAWGGDQSEDESEAEWDEHNRDEDERSRPDTRTQHRRLPEESMAPNRKPGRVEDRESGEGHDSDEHPSKKGIDKAKAAELGKDLLSQLAKELGLEIPTGERPAPRPTSHPSRPQPGHSIPHAPQPVPQSATGHAAAKAKASAVQAAREAAASAKMAQDRAKDRKTEISRRAAAESQASRYRQDAGEDTPRRAPGYLSTAPAAPMAPRVTAASTARAALMDVKSLRNALILKTILDKPLSLKPRRLGED